MMQKFAKIHKNLKFLQQQTFSISSPLKKRNVVLLQNEDLKIGIWTSKILNSTSTHNPVLLQILDVTLMSSGHHRQRILEFSW